MNVQWFVYDEAGAFLGLVLGHNRVRARQVAKDEFPDEKIGVVRAAPFQRAAEDHAEGKS